MGPGRGAGDNNHTLKVLNLWLALCAGDMGFPSFLADLGYSIIGVEQNYKLASGREIKPDITVVCRRQSHIILVETKSGKETKVRQLENYASFAQVDAEKVCSFKPTYYDCTVVGKHDLAHFLEINLVKGNHAFPLLGVHPDSVRLHYSAFQFKELNNNFSYLPVNWDSLPLRVILNSDSEDYEIAEVLLTVLTQGVLFQHEQPSMSLEEVCQEVWGAEYWNTFGTQEKNALRGHTDNLLLHAVNYFLSEFITYYSKTVAFKGDRLAKKNFWPRLTQASEKLLSCVADSDWAETLAKRKAKADKAKATRAKNKAAKEAAAEAKKLEETGQFKMFPGEVFDAQKYDPNFYPE